MNSKWRVLGCRCEEILPCFQDNKTEQQPRGIWVRSKLNWVPVSLSTQFKMAAVIRITRGKFIRFLPSRLHRKGYSSSPSIQPYVYHPQSRTLEPENQAFYLTKTLQMGDISSCLQDTVIDPTIREQMMSKFRQNVIQTRLINYEGDHATRNMCALPLMQNMLRVIWSYAGR